MFMKFMRYLYSVREDVDYRASSIKELMKYLSSDESTYYYADKMLDIILSNEIKLDTHLYVNLLSDEVYHHGKPLALTNTERMIVIELAEHANSIVPYESLIKAIWGYANDNSILKVNVSNIRNKTTIPIQSVKGVGYILMGA